MFVRLCCRSVSHSCYASYNVYYHILFYTNAYTLTHSLALSLSYTFHNKTTQQLKHYAFQFTKFSISNAKWVVFTCVCVYVRYCYYLLLLLPPSPLLLLYTVTVIWLWTTFTNDLHYYRSHIALFCFVFNLAKISLTPVIINKCFQHFEFIVAIVYYLSFK